MVSGKSAAKLRRSTKMSMDQALALIGIAITVLFGIAALLVAKKVRRQRQIQKVGKGGSAIQSGRDTKL
jgi:hypothetical protein